MSTYMHYTCDCICRFVQDLIQVDGAEENMDDDVFDEDKEVCEVMRGGAGQISPALLHSSSPIHSHHMHHQRQMSHNQVSSPVVLSCRQVVLSEQILSRG